MRYTFLFLLLLAFSCKTADKALSQGKNDKAFKIALKALKKGKSVKQNKAVLEESLTNILKRDEAKIAELSNSESLKDWDKALGINGDLQELIEKAQPYLGMTFNHKFDELEASYVELKADLADAYFNMGSEDLEKAIAENDKLLAQDAYHHFNKSEEYGNTDDRLDKLKEEAMKNGVMIYVVTTNTYDYSWDIDRAFDDVERESDMFKSIHYDRNVSDADCKIEISFGSVDVRYDEDTDTRSFEERVITGTETQVDTAGNETQIDIYETVRGTVYVRERIKIVSWNVDVDVRGYTDNCTLRDNSYREAIQSEIEETNWDGDERAIPDRYKRGSNNNDEFEETDDMAEELIERFYREIVRDLF